MKTGTGAEIPQSLQRLLSREPPAHQVAAADGAGATYASIAVNVHATIPCDPNFDLV
jgi:hypothetical protein